MAMGMSFVNKKVVATKIVAADGSGDYLDIQAAINDLPAGGGVVYIKEGTYTITSAINITIDNVGLFGAGKATKIATASNITMVNVDGSDCTIKDLYIYGSGAASDANDGIYIGDALSGVLVTGCFIENCGRYGIWVDTNSVDIKLISNSILSCVDFGIILYGGSGLTIDRAIVSNNYIASITYSAIALYHCTLSVIEGNICEGNGADGITVVEHVDNCILNSNVCEGNGAIGLNILVNTCDNNVVVGNRLTNNTTANLQDNGTGTTTAGNNTS